MRDPQPRSTAAPPDATATESEGTALDWRDIPVFIVNRNRLGSLQRLVDWLRRAGMRRVIILDNASRYPPLLAYYRGLPDGVQLMPFDQDHGAHVVWQQRVHAALETPYVVTDSAVVPADGCPMNVVEVLLDHLRRCPNAHKVGMAVRIDNLPPTFAQAQTVREREFRFWEHPVQPGVYAAPIDTTFALCAARSDHSSADCNLRLGHPYVAEHAAWYVDERELDAEERYRREHTLAPAPGEPVPSIQVRARVLHVDGGRHYVPGWLNAGSGAGCYDVRWDFGAGRDPALPLPDECLDGVLVNHQLERVADAHAAFDELYRVAKPGAKLVVRVAHGAHPQTWQDPRVSRAWYEGSFGVFAQPGLGSTLQDYRGDWQLESVGIVPGAHADTPIELVVTLRAIKPARPRAWMCPDAAVRPVILPDAAVDPMFRRATSGSHGPSPRASAPAGAPRTLFLLHEQRYLYFLEPSHLELYLPMVESGLLGETMVYAYQRDIRFVRQEIATLQTAGVDSGAGEEQRFRELLDHKLREFRPDLVVHALTWPNEAIPPATLAALKQKHPFALVSVIWDHDESNPLLQDYDRALIEVSDCTVVADSVTRSRAIQARTGLYAEFRNTDSVVFLPTVPPPSLFAPSPSRRHDVTISGSSEGHRVAVYEMLLAAGFNVHRSGGMMNGDGLLSVNAYARDLAQSRIVVNTQTIGQRIQLKGRVAQCLAAGTFLLEQDNPESRSYLRGIDVVFWRDHDDLLRLLRHHLAHDDEREAMALRAHRQWQARYSVQTFVTTMLDTVGRIRRKRALHAAPAWGPRDEGRGLGLG